MLPLWDTPLPLASLLRIALVTLAVSLLLAWLEETLRRGIWAVLNLAAAPLAFAARALLQLTQFLRAPIQRALHGLTQEGDEESGSRTWIGWYLLGPLVYLVFFVIFLASDFSIAYLVFEAFGLVSGGHAGVLATLPLDLAAALLFVALGAFWGLFLFDLTGATPFAFIWSRFSPRSRRLLFALGATAIGLTFLAALLMGLWRQWQLTPFPPPEPWNSWVPPTVSALIVLLVVAATAAAGKPIGGGLASLWVALLYLARGGAYGALVALRGAVFLLRQLIHLPLALLSLNAYLGRRLWNWLCGFRWAAWLHFRAVGEMEPLADLGGDLDTPVVAPKADAELPVLPPWIDPIGVDTGAAAANGKAAHVTVP